MLSPARFTTTTVIASVLQLALLLYVSVLVTQAAPPSSVPVCVIETSQAGMRLTPRPDIYLVRSSGKDNNNNNNQNADYDMTLKLDKRIKYQSIFGFGGAFTEASAYVYSTMSPKRRQEILDAYFHPERGLNYTMGRIHMNSCDFSINTYSCDDVEGDYSLSHFNINRDRVYVLPFLKDSLRTIKQHTPTKNLEIFLSPWSPPAWMKGNHNMNGSSIPGLIDSSSVYSSWALFYSKFISAYKNEGIDIWGMTIQNESEFAAPWEACVYTPEGQRDFIKKYLGPVMRRDHPHVKIMIFDHNKDSVVTWVKTIMSDPEAAQYVSGTAIHWYVVQQYEHLTEAHNVAPSKFLLATEACHGPGVLLNDWPRGEQYGFDIIQDLNNYAVGWVDWNMILDMQGGPNHLQNYCDAPIIADAKTDTVHYQVMYYVLGHFSKYMLKNSVRIGQSMDHTGNEVLATAALTPAGRVVVIVQNLSNNKYRVRMADVVYGMDTIVVMEPRSIKTLYYDGTL